MYDLGLRIKNLRLQRGITQETLGRRINKSKSAVCSYETNAQLPPLDVAISIASALNVSLEQLIGFDTEEYISTSSLKSAQKKVLDLLISEFLSPSSNGCQLSPQQIQIIQKIILIFS